MWIHSRTPSPSGSAETASSKSRAVAGSTVKVGSPVRSRRSPAARGRRLTASRASSSISRLKPRCVPRSQMSASTTSRARSAEPSGRSTLAPRAPKSTSTISPGPTLGPPARVACGPRSNSGSTTGKRPRRSTLATRRPRPAPRRGLTGSRRRCSRPARRAPSVAVSSCLVRLRVVLDLDVGLDPLAEQRGAVRREVLADRQVERAPAVEVDDLLEDPLAVGPRADDGRHVVLSAAPRSGSRLPRRCCGRSGRRSASSAADRRRRRRPGRPACGSAWRRRAAPS